MKRLKLNRWLIALITIAMTALVFMPDEKKVNIQIDSDHPEADYTMEQVTITQFSKSGEQNHRLTAQKMIHYNEIYSADGERNFEAPNNLENEPLEKTNLNSEMSILVNPKVYYKSEKSEWQLSANVGRMTNQQSQLFLEDEVELTEKQSNNIDFNNNLTKVTTKNLQINLVTKLAQTKDDVILTAENLTANSIGMKIDIEKSKVHLLSNVRSQLTKIKK